MPALGIAVARISYFSWLKPEKVILIIKQSK